MTEAKEMKARDLARIANRRRPADLIRLGAEARDLGTPIEESGLTDEVQRICWKAGWIWQHERLEFIVPLQVAACKAGRDPEALGCNLDGPAACGDDLLESLAEGLIKRGPLAKILDKMNPAPGIGRWGIPGWNGKGQGCDRESRMLAADKRIPKP